jgi:hypothetical protein
MFGRVWPWSRHRRSVELVQLRSDLAGRGVPVGDLSDSDLEQLVRDGRQVLATAHVRGSDTTGAFVVAVRKQQKF